MIEQDRRKNNVGDRCKHLSIQMGATEKTIDVAIEALVLAKKEIQLEKADLKHLMDDIYGIKNKEENNGT